MIFDSKKYFLLCQRLGANTKDISQSVRRIHSPCLDPRKISHTNYSRVNEQILTCI